MGRLGNTQKVFPFLLKETNNYVNMWLQKDVYDDSIKFTQNYSYQ